MGITIYSMPRHHLKRRINRKRKLTSTCKYNYKKIKQSMQIDFVSLFEDMLYNLNTSCMHLKLYIKRLMYEYVAETRQEIAVFYAMALNLYKETSDAYYGVMNNKRNVIEIDIKDLQEKYDSILDLCGITNAEVYDALFDENDDGYETPPREEEDEPTPASLCEEIENDDSTSEEEDEAYNATIESMNMKLSIK